MSRRKTGTVNPCPPSFPPGPLFDAESLPLNTPAIEVAMGGIRVARDECRKVFAAGRLSVEQLTAIMGHLGDALSALEVVKHGK